MKISRHFSVFVNLVLHCWLLNQIKFVYKWKQREYLIETHVPKRTTPIRLGSFNFRKIYGNAMNTFEKPYLVHTVHNSFSTAIAYLGNRKRHLEVIDDNAAIYAVVHTYLENQILSV